MVFDHSQTQVTLKAQYASHVTSDVAVVGNVAGLIDTRAPRDEIRDRLYDLLLQAIRCLEETSK